MIDDSDIFSIVVDRNRPQRVFAGACSGTYRSLSGGARWAKLPQSKDASYRTYTLAQDPQYENVLFAGTTQGMIKSRDGGATWQKIAPYSTRSIAFDMSKLGRIYIATDDAGILRSDDNGKTWRDANRGFLQPAAHTAGNRRKRRHLHKRKLRGRRFDVLRPAQRQRGMDERKDPGQGGDHAHSVAADFRYVLRGHGPRAARLARMRARVGAPRRAFTEAPLTALVAPRWDSDALLAAAGSSLFISRDFGRELDGAAIPRADPIAVGARAAMDRRDHRIGDSGVEGWRASGSRTGA